MKTVTLYVIGKVIYEATILCGPTACPTDQRFTWYNEFETVEECEAQKEARITWLQSNYKFKYSEEPDYICAESITS